jgi:hypothetical protein
MAAVKNVLLLPDTSLQRNPQPHQVAVQTGACGTQEIPVENGCSRSMFDAKHGDIRNGHGSDFKDGRHCFRG